MTGRRQMLLDIEKRLEEGRQGPMNWLDIGLRLVVALGCGALIGIERQYRQHSAG